MKGTIKLDFEQRKLANALSEEMADCADIDVYAFELIWLRQRVKELDRLLDKVGTAANENGFDSIAALLEWLPELAALKAGQGEPVCYLREEWLSYEQSAEGQPGAFPVYTAAPSIPEGWRLVPVEPTPEMIAARVGFYDGGRTNAEYSCIAGYKAMLSAAPKHTKEAE